MRNIIIYTPPKLVFGSGSLDQFIDDYLQSGLKYLYLITVPAVISSLDQLICRLNDAGVNMEIFDQLQGEPTFSQFEIILEKARNFGTDSVAGIGGGSVMDVAKLLAAQLKNEQSTESVIGIGLLKERKTFLACLPTTSGTGSEVSPNAIFLDESDNCKKGVISPFLVPDVAYIDPLLTIGMPPSITAFTGLDALTHCIEAYINVHAHPMVDLFALEGIRLISRNLYKAWQNGNDIEARANIALGSVYGGICLGPVNTAAVHALAYPLGSIYKIAHGLSNSLLLPYIMEFNMEASLPRHVDVALALGSEKKKSDKETALNGIIIIRKLIKDCNLPSCLSELNIPEEAIPGLAESAMQVKRLLKNNVRKITCGDAISIYQKAMRG